jgi:hypothetical protein
MIDTIKKSNFNINMEYICIDNKQIRNRIINSKNIKFNMVPCILLVYPNKKIEQYEGTDAFNLVNGIISYLNQRQLEEQNQKVLQEEQIQQQKHIEVVVENKKQKKVKEETKKKTIIDSSSEEEEDDDELEVTPIDLEIINDEESNEECEEEVNRVSSSIKRPKKHVRMNDGNYEDMYNEDDYVPPEYDTKKLRGIKTAGKKDSSISSLAQQLAKERELDQENIKPNQTNV